MIHTIARQRILPLRDRPHAAANTAERLAAIASLHQPDDPPSPADHHKRTTPPRASRTPPNPPTSDSATSPTNHHSELRAERNAATGFARRTIRPTSSVSRWAESRDPGGPPPGARHEAAGAKPVPPAIADPALAPEAATQVGRQPELGTRQQVPAPPTLCCETGPLPAPHGGSGQAAAPRRQVPTNPRSVRSQQLAHAGALRDRGFPAARRSAYPARNRRQRTAS